MRIRSIREFIESSVPAQIALVLLCWLAGAGFARATGLPVSANLAGFALLLVALATGLLPVASIGRGADWLLARMLVFFVPAVLAVLEYREFLGWLGVKILAVIVGSTVAVMLVTMLVVRLAEPRATDEGAQR